jgi:hypothetical protein
VAGVAWLCWPNLNCLSASQCFDSPPYVVPLFLKGMASCAGAPDDVQVRVATKPPQYVDIVYTCMYVTSNDSQNRGSCSGTATHATS